MTLDLRRLYAVVWDARSWRLAAWQILSFPSALLWGVLAWVLYAVGAGLVVVWIGVPVLALSQVLMRAVGRFEASVAQSVVDEAPIPVRPLSPATGLDRWGLVVRRLTDAMAWRTAAWSAGRLVIGPVAFCVALAAVLAPAIVVGQFVMGIVALSLGWPGPSYQALAYLGLVVSVVLLVTGVPALWWLNRGIGQTQLCLLRWAVGPSARSLLTDQQRRAERAEERVRIDQELHDSIGHMITMNTVQAGAGAHVFDSDPEFARQALRTIEERGRAAMGELDRIIATVRAEEEGRSDGAERAPLPGLDDVPALVAQSQAAGIRVTVAFEPPPGVSAAVGRAVFGVVREALTNAARYAPGAPVTVVVVGDGDAVGVEVRNGAPTSGGPASGATGRGGRDGTGRGLAGIRDRAILLGGRASTGPLEGGFCVRALLPLGAALGPADPDRPSRFEDLRGSVGA